LELFANLGILKDPVKAFIGPKINKLVFLFLHGLARGPIVIGVPGRIGCRENEGENRERKHRNLLCQKHRSPKTTSPTAPLPRSRLDNAMSTKLVQARAGS